MTLQNLIFRSGKSVYQVALEMDMTPQNLYHRMKYPKRFRVDQLERLAEILDKPEIVVLKAMKYKS